MNRGKSYRLLMVLLFFAFISLISRSLIYLIISLTVAVIIILLLSKDLKGKNKQQTTSQNSPEQKGEKSVTSIFQFVMLIIGSILLAYGITGYFQMGSNFIQLIPTNEPFLFILAIIVGGLMTFSSFTMLLKKYLES